MKCKINIIVLTSLISFYCRSQVGLFFNNVHLARFEEAKMDGTSDSDLILQSVVRPSQKVQNGIVDKR